jgi:hypothetical protein
MFRRWWWVFGIVIVAALVLAVFVYDAQAPAMPTAALPLTQTFDQSPTGFTLRYPEEWDYIIPDVGVAVFGPSEALNNGVPGPTFHVQRSFPLSVVGTLDAAMDRFLQNGPLRNPDRWHVVEAVQPVQVEGRDARTVVVEGADSAAAPPLRSRITAVSSDNTFVYFFIASVPVANLPTYEATFDAILASVRILE